MAVTLAQYSLSIYDAAMCSHKPSLSLAGILLSTAAIGTAIAWWSASPIAGEFNLVFTAIVIAFVCALTTPGGARLAFAAGAMFIAISLAAFVKPDPSGLGPPTITIPIQLIFASGPMAGAAWLGRQLRGWLSPLPSGEAEQ